MHDEMAELLPDGESGFERVESKHGDEKNSRNADDPGQPVNYFV